MAVATILIVGMAASLLRRPAESPRPIAERKKPNIIVISACSIAAGPFRLIEGAIGQKDPMAPSPQRKRFASVMRGAMQLQNYVTRHPWVFLFEYIRDRLSPARLRELGYDYYYSDVPGLSTVMRIPQLQGQLVSEGPLVLNFQESLSNLKEITTSLKEPFLFQLHAKYMHFPYYDGKNKAFLQYLELTPALRKRLEELLARKSIAPAEEIPLAVLFDRVKRPEAGAASILSNQSNYTSWKGSPHFDLDRQLILAVYRAKFYAFITDLRELMNLYGRGHLMDNTIVLFDADHGEAMMQHGLLGHASHVYEEFIHTALWIRFPPPRSESEPFKPVPYQVTKETVADMLVELVKGNLREENIMEWLRSHESEVVVSRNCPGTVYSARTKDHQKLIVDFESGSRQFYDIGADPGEARNLIDERAEAADALYETILMQKAEVDSFLDRDPSGCSDTIHDAGAPNTH